MLGVDEDRHVAGLHEIDERNEIGRALDAIVAFRCQISERRCEQRSAKTISDAIHRTLVSGFFDCRHRRDRALEHIVLEALVSQACVRIDPGDDEDRVPLFDTPADERILWLEIEDVEFVDPRRNDQQRRFTYLLCHRRVLDELDHFVLENDLARRRRNIFAEPERIHIRHSNAEAALSALQVVKQIRQAAEQVLAAGLNRL